jgi:hypothetical protein
MPRPAPPASVIPVALTPSRRHYAAEAPMWASAKRQWTGSRQARAATLFAQGGDTLRSNDLT